MAESTPLLVGVRLRPPILTHWAECRLGTSLSINSPALSPLKVWSTPGTAPVSRLEGIGRGGDTGVVGMHVMGWTSELTSKHGTNGKGMEERDT